MLRNTVEAWGALAKFLHWIIAALVLAQMALGWLAVGWRLSPTKIDLFVWHKSIGLSILTLMLARVAWWLANPVPALPATMPAMERRAAHASHLLLYLLLMAMPLTGWVVSSASNIPFRIFWLVPLPAIVVPGKAMQGLGERAHLYLFVALAAVLAVHIGAALRHHFVQRDSVLRRMLPVRRLRS